ncbi:MAG: HAMP domain-containing histidine kinase [Kordiimonadaceae bacterium]|jgi:signal transduction histidine kinase|nr:HAMP domain-containing histidine kinase [Kordiimonadaceae bacterium]MBT6033889.1 HAMP domain-containing histidine kinase [Kordiimonadaceae bacterium]
MQRNIRKVPIKESLSTRLLMFTIFFVLIAEILIYVPSIASFRQNWIEQKITAANIAILVIEAAPDYIVSRMLADELLSSTETHSIIRIMGEDNQQALFAIEEFEISAKYDMRNLSWWVSIKDAFTALSHMQNNGRIIEVTGHAMGNLDEDIIITFNEDLLYSDMYTYSGNIVLLTIVISLFTAMLVYYSLSNLFVRPVKKITDNLVAFRKAPEDMTTSFIPEDREDEIGVVMREFSAMQEDIRKALNQKTHLAKLGSAISNINHDLRNMLASVQLVTDHLATIDNPIVQQLAPRFVKSLDRAIRLCENTLQYGGGDIEKPKIDTCDLRSLIDDVSTSLGLLDNSNIKLINKITPGFEINVDNDQIFRVFMNICRNAVQAIIDKGHITVRNTLEDNMVLIDITDTGPGIPDKIKQNLFEPFKSGSNGGAGLGLAISKEIIIAHGGTLELIESNDKGSTFRITLPL